MRIRIGFKPKITQRRLRKQKYFLCAFFGGALILILAFMSVQYGVRLYGLTHVQSYTGILSGVDDNRKPSIYSAKSPYIINIDGIKFCYFGEGMNNSFKTRTQFDAFLQSQIGKTVSIKYSRCFRPSTYLLSLEIRDQTCVVFEEAFSAVKSEVVEGCWICCILAPIFILLFAYGIGVVRFLPSKKQSAKRKNRI